MERRIEKVYLPIFTGQPIGSYTQQIMQQMKTEVEEEKPATILGVNETDYIEYLIRRYSILTPRIDFDVEKGIAEGNEDRSNKRDIFADPDLVFTYHLPFTGDYHFLRYRPNPPKKEKPEDTPPFVYFPFVAQEGYSPYYLEENIAKSEMNVYALVYRYSRDKRYCDSFEIARQTIERDIESYTYHSYISEEVKEERINELKEALRYIDHLSEPYIHIEIRTSKVKQREIEADIRAFLKDFKRTAQKLVQDIEKHNAKVCYCARDFFLTRKRRLLKQLGIVKAIGYPIKKQEDVPATFDIPTDDVIKQIQINKPVVSEDKYVPEPTLNETIYHDILQTIYDLGKVIERKPTVYRDKYEPALRDLFLLNLEPRYKGAATGETFNGKGKTDILIRYENSNVFVAECKVWHGSQRYLEGISQLLKNVVWRDSKTAIIIFVKYEPITQVMKQIREITCTHPNYLGFLNEENEGWYNFRFHINGDHNREVKLAVMVFWVPQENTKVLEFPEEIA
jgi:hypothetical protein